MKSWAFIDRWTHALSANAHKPKLIDYPLLALELGVRVSPQGDDKGPITRVMEYCRAKAKEGDTKYLMYMLSDVPDLMKEAGIGRTIRRPKNKNDPDEDFWIRHDKKMRSHRKRIDDQRRAAEASKKATREAKKEAAVADNTTGTIVASPLGSDSRDGNTKDDFDDLFEDGYEDTEDDVDYASMASANDDGFAHKHLARTLFVNDSESEDVLHGFTVAGASYNGFSDIPILPAVDDWASAPASSSRHGFHLSAPSGHYHDEDEDTPGVAKPFRF